MWDKTCQDSGFAYSIRIQERQYIAYGRALAESHDIEGTRLDPRRRGVRVHEADQRFSVLLKLFETGPIHRLEWRRAPGISARFSRVMSARRSHPIMSREVTREDPHRVFVAGEPVDEEQESGWLSR